MFCTNCGKPTEDGKNLCPACAAEKAANAPVQEVTPQAAPQPAPEAPVFEPFSYPTEPQPAAPKKTGLLIGLVCAAVALIGVVVLALSVNWNALFLSPQERIAKAEVNALKESALYQGVRAGLKGENDALDPAHADTQLTLTLGEDILPAVEDLLAQEGANLDIDWVQSLLVNATTNINEEVSSMDLGLGVNNTTLATLRLVTDFAEDKIYLGLPGLSEDYLAVDLDDADVDAEQFEKAFALLSGEQTKKLQEKMPDPDAVVDFLDKYLTLALEQLEDVEKNTEKVEIDGISQKMTVISVDISEEDAQKMAIAVLEELKEDKEAKELLEQLIDYYDEVAELSGEELELPDVDEIFEQIPDAIDELEDLDADTDDVLRYSVYLDNKDNLCGRCLEDLEDDAFVISTLKATKGKKFASEFKIESEGQALVVEGSGNDKESVYVVEFDEMELFTVEVSGLDESALKKGQLIGEFRLTLSDEVTNMLKQNLGSEVGALISIAEPSLHLTYQKDSAEIGLYMGDKLIVSLASTAKKNKAGNVEIPENTLDPEEAEDFLSGLEIDKLIDNLEKAGVPDDYVDALDSLADYYF